MKKQKDTATIISKLSVDGNNSKMAFDYNASSSTRIPASIYIGRNGDGKSFSMRMLNDFLEAMNYLQEKDTEENAYLRYNHYRLDFNSKEHTYSIDTGNLNEVYPVFEKTDDNVIPPVRLRDLAVNKDEHPIINSDDKMKILRMLPVTIAPDYAYTGKVNQPWCNTKRIHRFEYKKILKRIFERKDQKIKTVLNSTLSSLCGYTIEYQNKELICIKDGDALELDWLSSGEKNILYNWTYILYKLYSLRKNESALIMIDEPEASLHPEWQRRYLPSLLEMIGKTKKEAQILMATHSPFIVSALKKEQARVYTVDTENDGKDERIKYVKKTVPADSAYGLDADSTLCSIMGIDDTRSESFCKEFSSLIKAINKRKDISNHCIRTKAEALKSYLPDNDELGIFLNFILDGDLSWQ